MSTDDLCDFFKKLATVRYFRLKLYLIFLLFFSTESSYWFRELLFVFLFSLTFPCCTDNKFPAVINCWLLNFVHLLIWILLLLLLLLIKRFSEWLRFLIQSMCLWNCILLLFFVVSWHVSKVCAWSLGIVVPTLPAILGLRALSILSYLNL